MRSLVRSLLRTPGFTIVAVLTLALGIGANAALFSVVYGVFLKPLGFHEPDRLVTIWNEFPEAGLEQANPSAVKFEHVQENRPPSLQGVAAVANDGFSVIGRGDPEQIGGARASGGFFEVLGVKPLFGRTFAAEEEKPGGPNVVLLSHAWWVKRFQSDRNVLGANLTLNGVPHTVIGVMPPLSFPFAQSNVWVPRVREVSYMTPEQIERASGYLRVVGRLAPGATTTQVTNDLAVVAPRYLARGPERVDAKTKLTAYPFHQNLVRDIRPMVLLLAAAVGSVLLVACANVANLMLARHNARQKENAVRLALGAPRSAIILRFAGEGILLALAGAALGLLVARLCLSAIQAWGADILPAALEISINLPVLLAAVGLAVLTGAALGLVPAWQLARGSALAALNETSRGSSGSASQGRIRAGLLVAEVAVSLVLLVGAALLLNSFLRLSQVNPGFPVENLHVMGVSMPLARYPDRNAQATFTQRFLEALRAQPGVRAAGGSGGVPFDGNNSFTPVADPTKPMPAPGERPLALRRPITPGYIAALGVPILRGREFTERDGPEATPVCLITRTAAKRFFGDVDPIGRTLVLGIASTHREIVGLVEDIRSQDLATAPREEFYIPASQVGENNLAFVVRTELRGLAVANAFKQALATIDPQVPTNPVQTMAEMMRQSIATRSVAMQALGGFAGVALLLASLGIYSVLAYSVSQRTNEIGIRMALGADAAAVRKLVVREGMTLTLIGLAVGLVIAFFASRLLGNLLYGIGGTDPVTYLAVAALLALVALLACWLPAHRATRVDPMNALRT
ncbi:MAG: ABC transporter permease [Verrucomicrobia bacterium]|nr:ABC transporter permease [Verrucomicrobiota bacterium]